MNWKHTLDEVLRGGMKYCFIPKDGKYPEFDEIGYEGGVDDQGKAETGFLDLIISIVHDFRKKAFFAGYVKGASDAYMDLNMPETDFDEEISRQGAWKAWADYEAERIND